MGMSNAERQKKFRERRDADPEKRRKYLQYSKQRYMRDRLSGKNPSITNMTARERRRIRRRWRKQKRRDRERAKGIQSAVENELTPPSTPSEAEVSSRQKKNNVKKVKREKAKCYRENKKLEEELKSYKKQIDRYKKRLMRFKQTTNVSTDSPRTKTRKLLRNMTPRETKKCLFMYNVVIEQLRKKYRERKKKAKENFKEILSDHVLKKYKLKTRFYKLIGIHAREEKKSMKGYSSVTKRVCDKVKSFYTRNDNSRLITGKRQTKTHKKVKKQRRVLLHNLKILYHKFISEGKTKISYSVFCRLRPFFVVFPRQSDRNTCMCKICDNTELMVASLAKVNAIDTDDLDKIMQRIVCDVKDERCIFRSCAVCKGNRIEVDKHVLDKDVTWFEWKTKTEKRVLSQGNKKIEKEVTLTVKEQITDTTDTLFDKFEVQLERYIKHLFRCKAQYNYYKERIEGISDKECILNIDFSENYVCKYSKEIHSVHFGASKKQITLHTGVAYLHNKPPMTFCTVSESLNHGPAAVWAHLRPVLEQIRTENPNVCSLEIFSDGPVTQYRQKGNFYLTTTCPKQLGFENVQWSFFESGHGKGIPDAVGGFVKRSADDHVKYGKDIMNAKDFCDVLSSGSKSKIYLIDNSSVLEKQALLDSATLKAVPGTMNLHQIVYLNHGKVAYRNVSCSCEIGTEHKGHEFSKADLESKNEQCKASKVSQKKSSNMKENDQRSDYKDESDMNSQNKSDGKRRQKSNSARTKATDPSQLHYETILHRLSTSKSFNDLKLKCEKLNLPDLNVIPAEINLYSNKLDVDFDVIPDIPDDIQDSRELFPCDVQADGNCLPSCGSVYAYGCISRTAELRVRIINELAIHEDCYLNDEFLSQGIEGENLASKYSQYSEYYIPGVTLNRDLVKDIYRREVLSITKDRSFMGIWQVFALATVLKSPILSVYPMKGNMNVRKDLNRLIMPRINQNPDAKPVYILWTSNRDDIPNEHWVPNHFVPLLPFSEQRPQNSEEKGDEHVNNHDHDPSEISNVDSNNNITSDIPEIEKCVGKYVLVNYRGKAYPGLIEDVEGSDVQINCMHQLGKRTENCFFWPRKLKDLSWYDYEDIIVVISEPVSIDNSRHYRIEDNAWEYALNQYK